MLRVFSAPLEKISRRYLRAQAVALLATGLDFLVTLALREGAGLYYAAAVFAGASCGAVTAFLLNRHWVFRAGELPAGGQLLRFILALGGSVLINTGGTYLLTETAGLHYLLSKMLVAVAVGLTYSYIVLKHFVFTPHASN